MRKSECGIYMILNLLTDTRYVGHTKDSFTRRWTRHRFGLRQGAHECPTLQQDWMLSGGQAFRFVILETLPKISDQFTIRERHWCEHFRTQDIKLYNRMLNGYHITEYTKRRLTETKRGAPRPDVAKRFARDWLPFVGPDGAIYHIHNLNAFCKERGLCMSAMSKVVRGIRLSHKGFHLP